MRSSFTADTGLRLARTPSPRRQAARFKFAIAALLALALAGGAVGVATAPRDHTAHTGPFSYFPSQ